MKPKFQRIYCWNILSTTDHMSMIRDSFVLEFLAELLCFRILQKWKHCSNLLFLANFEVESLWI